MWWFSALVPVTATATKLSRVRATLLLAKVTAYPWETVRRPKPGPRFLFRWHSQSPYMRAFLRIGLRVNGLPTGLLYCKYSFMAYMVSKMSKASLFCNPSPNQVGGQGFHFARRNP